MDFKFYLKLYPVEKKVERDKIREGLRKRRFLPAAETCSTAISSQNKVRNSSDMILRRKES